MLFFIGGAYYEPAEDATHGFVLRKAGLDFRLNRNLPSFRPDPLSAVQIRNAIGRGVNRVRWAVQGSPRGTIRPPRANRQANQYLAGYVDYRIRRAEPNFAQYYAGTSTDDSKHQIKLNADAVDAELKGREPPRINPRDEFGNIVTPRPRELLRLPPAREQPTSALAPQSSAPTLAHKSREGTLARVTRLAGAIAKDVVPQYVDLVRQTPDRWRDVGTIKNTVGGFLHDVISHEAFPDVVRIIQSRIQQDKGTLKRMKRVLSEPSSEVGEIEPGSWGHVKHLVGRIAKDILPAYGGDFLGRLPERAGDVGTSGKLITQFLHDVITHPAAGELSAIISQRATQDKETLRRLGRKAKAVVPPESRELGDGQGEVLSGSDPRAVSGQSDRLGLPSWRQGGQLVRQRAGTLARVARTLIAAPRVVNAIQSIKRDVLAHPEVKALLQNDNLSLDHIRQIGQHIVSHPKTAELVGQLRNHLQRYLSEKPTNAGELEPDVSAMVHNAVLRGFRAPQIQRLIQSGEIPASGPLERVEPTEPAPRTEADINQQVQERFRSGRRMSPSEMLRMLHEQTIGPSQPLERESQTAKPLEQPPSETLQDAPQEITPANPFPVGSSKDYLIPPSQRAAMRQIDDFLKNPDLDLNALNQLIRRHTGGRADTRKWLNARDKAAVQDAVEHFKRVSGVLDEARLAAIREQAADLARDDIVTYGLDESNEPDLVDAYYSELIKNESRPHNPADWEELRGKVRELRNRSPLAFASFLHHAGQMVQSAQSDAYAKNMPPQSSDGPLGELDGTPLRPDYSPPDHVRDVLLPADHHRGAKTVVHSGFVQDPKNNAVHRYDLIADPERVKINDKWHIPVWSVRFPVNGGYETENSGLSRDAGIKILEQVQERLKDFASRLPNGSLIYNTPISDRKGDVQGKNRRAIVYRRAGFGRLTSQDGQYGIVINGKIHPLDEDDLRYLVTKSQVGGQNANLR